MLSKDLEETLRRVVLLANEPRHEYATLEHLLLALLDDPDAVQVLAACAVQLDVLRAELINFLDVDLAGLATDRFVEAKPTAGIERVKERAKLHVESAGRTVVNGANVLVALFSERESHAVYYLQLQDMTRLDAVQFMSHGIVKRRNIPHVPPVHLVPPPKLPAQGAGPHAELNSEGIVGFAPPESLDRNGNHLSRLHGLHPDLRELARELAASLAHLIHAQSRDLLAGVA